MTTPAVVSPKSTDSVVNVWKPTVAPRAWKYIVVHHTATETGSVDSIHEAHVQNKDKNGKPWLGIGYHFVIGNGAGMIDGEIEPTFRWKQQLHGAHAGSDDPEYNQLGIGVCLVGNFEKEPPTAAQRVAVKRLVTALKNEYTILETRVVAHKDVRAAATACPGKLFEMADVATDWSNGPRVQLTWTGAMSERLAAASGSSLR